MPQLTEYDATTLKRVVNHDAARRQKELDAALARLNPQTTQVASPGAPAPEPPVDRTNPPVDPATALGPTTIEFPDPVKPTPPASPAPAQAAAQRHRLLHHLPCRHRKIGPSWRSGGKTLKRP